MIIKEKTVAAYQPKKKEQWQYLNIETKTIQI